MHDLIPINHRDDGTAAVSGRALHTDPTPQQAIRNMERAA